MPRYVDTDKILQKLPDDLPYKASVKRVLIQAEESDVEEVVHGEWIEDTKYLYGGDFICSICGNEADESSGGSNNILTNYCSRCGAKMDVERKE